MQKRGMKKALRRKSAENAKDLDLLMRVKWTMTGSIQLREKSSGFRSRERVHRSGLYWTPK